MKKNLLHLAIIFMSIGLLLRIFYSVHFPLPVKKDAKEYNFLAKNLAEGKGYTNLKGEPTALRPPGYPFFLAVIYRIFGESHLVVRIIQSLLGIISCWGIYLIGKAWGGIKTGLTALGLSCFYPPFISYYYAPRGILSETLYVFLFIFFLYYLISGIKEHPKSSLCLGVSGLFLGLVTLTRGVTLLLPIVVLLALWIAGIRGRMLWRKFFIFFLPFLLVLFPWNLRNYLVFSKFVPVSTNGGLSFYASNHPSSNGLGGKIYRNITLPLDEELAKKGLNEAERSSYFLKEGMQFILRTPQRSLKLFIRKFFLFWDFNAENYLRDKVYMTYNFAYMFILPFSLLGIFFPWKQEKNKLTWVFLLLLVYFSFFHTVVHTSTRYRIPLESILIILGSAGILYAFQTTPRKLFWSLLGIWVAFNAWIYFTYPAFTLWIKRVI